MCRFRPPSLSSFSSCGHHRHLHSFPTRRSSDLSAATARLSQCGCCCHPTASGGAAAHLARQLPAERRILASLTAARSEEHTSELQSLTNLVCRLLLEKKKTERSPTPQTNEYADG